MKSCVVYCCFMLLNKKTVLNENRVRVHVRWTEKSGNQIWLDWLIESDGHSRGSANKIKELLQNIGFFAVFCGIHAIIDKYCTPTLR